MMYNKSLSIDLVISNKCNFNCLYCSIGNELTINKKKEIINDNLCINFIDKLLLDERYKNYKFSINFWGGEPSIEYKIVNNIINYYLNNERISFLLYTNGSNQLFKINLENILNLPINNTNYGKLKIQISYDGGKNQDLFRRTKQNKPTSDIVKNNINKISLLIKDNTNIQLKLKSTIDYSSFNNLYNSWLDVYKIANKYNNNINISLNYSLTADTCIDYFKTNINDNYLNDLHINMINILNYINKNNIENPLFNWLNLTNSKPLCSFGNNLIAINTDNNIYACHNFYDNKDNLFIGNINDEDIIDKIINKSNYYKKIVNDFTLSEKCKQCKTSFCMKCNISCLYTSKKETFEEKLIDYNSCNNSCKLYKELNKYRIALFKIRNK